MIRIGLLAMLAQMSAVAHAALPLYTHATCAASSAVSAKIDIASDMHELILRLWEENRMTIFMVSHDIQESFQLGTRLLTFDKLRVDPQSPEAYGASVTYDMPLRRTKSARS